MTHLKTQKFRDAVTSTIVNKDPELTLRTIIGLKDVKQCLKDALKFTTTCCEDECQLINSILLFGPDENEHYPLAEALANKWKATLFRVSGSNLEEIEWWKSTTYMKELLQVASEKSPSIIFIDEIDKLNKQSKNVLIRRMRKHKEVIVIGSTSHPSQFDSSFQSWFKLKLLVPLPDFELRRTLIKSEIGSAWHCLSNEELNLMANMTKGYKRLDISKIVQQLLENQQRLLKSSNYFVKVSGHLIGSPRMIVKDMFIPCLAKQPNSLKAKATDFRSNNVLAPPILINHFFYVIDKFKKPSRKSLEECRLFNRKHVPEPRGFTVKVTSKTQKKRGCFSRMFCL